MANEVERSIKSAAKKIALYVDNIATLTVVTNYVNVTDAGVEAFDQAQPGMRTIIRLDGDCETVLPIEQNPDGLAINSEIFEVHERNVNTAIEYRARIMSSLLETMRSFT